MEHERLLEELCQVMRYLYVKGLVSALSGNASVRLDEGKIAITPSRKEKFLLRPEDISIVSSEGEHLSGPRPSIEVRMHLRVYQSCGSCGSVVHVHGLFAPLLMGVVDPFVDLEIKALGIKICYVDELPPGSKELAEAVGKAVERGCNGVVLKNHGIIGIGRNLGEAVEIVEAVENSFKKGLILKMLNAIQ